jgi:hypothetical protein
VPVASAAEGEAEERQVEGKSIFISSCSRRQLARRRATRYALRIQVMIAVIVVAAAVGMLLAARGGM